MKEIIERFNLDPLRNKVVLVNPSQYSHVQIKKEYTQFVPPISSMTVSANLESRGYQTEIFDMRISSQEELEFYLKENQSDIAFVGLTVFVGAYISASREITKLAKKYDLKVVWGGPLPDVFPESCLKECDAVSGAMNYEHALDWSKVGMNKIQEPFLAYLFTSMGCPYRCTFCYLQSEKKKTYFRTAESVISEMDILNKDYGISEFQIGDDNFFTNKPRSIEILNTMREKGYTISKVIGAQNDFTPPIVEAMSGIVKTVIFSIESASQRIIKRIKKPVKLEKVQALNELLSSHNISIINNIIIGWPFEEQEDRDKILPLFKSMKESIPDFRGIVYVYTSLPKTPLTYEVEEKYGKFPENLDFWDDCEFEANEATLKYRPWLTMEMQEKLCDEAAAINKIYNISKNR